MSYKFETLQLHVGQEQADPATDSRAVPIYQTTSYVFHNSQHAADRFGLKDSGNIYGRLTNSTQDVLEKRIAALEGGVASLAVASGAAAISYTLQALAANGGHIVAQKTIYGGSYKCEHCQQIINVVCIDDSTVIREFSKNYYLKPDRCGHYSEDGRFCVLCRYSEFMNNPEKYIDRAYDKLNEPIAKCVTYKGINHRGNY